MKTRSIESYIRGIIDFGLSWPQKTGIKVLWEKYSMMAAFYRYQKHTLEKHCMPCNLTWLKCLFEKSTDFTFPPETMRLLVEMFKETHRKNNCMIPNLLLKLKAEAHRSECDSLCYVINLYEKNDYKILWGGESNYLMMYKNIPIDISESTAHKAVCVKPLDGTNCPVSGVFLNCRRVIF